jgi:putative protease
MTLYRNYDHEFETRLAKKSAERKIKIEWLLHENDFGISLTATDEEVYSATVTAALPKEPAKKELSGIIVEQLGKLGNTIFQAEKVDNQLTDNLFIPLSVLSDLRRKAIESLLRVRKISLSVGANLCVRPTLGRGSTSFPYPMQELTYLGNVANEKARSFYKQHCIQTIAPAFELETQQNVPLMFTKHCLKYQLGYCTKQRKSDTLHEPLTLFAGANHLQLKFDCGKCEMQVYS